MEYQLVETFFTDLEDYLHFFLDLKEARRATPDGNCIASLKKEGDVYVYVLEWENGKFLGDYVQSFLPNEKNLLLFHNGCAEVARLLRIYLETGDAEQIRNEPPPFGKLTSRPPESSIEPNTSKERVNTEKYFPQIRDARLVKRYDVKAYDVVLLTDVKCNGMISCSHMLVALEKSTKETIYVIAAEVNNLGSQSDGSHFLCCYPGTGHINLGSSDGWGHLSRFEKEACELMSAELGILVA
jgi:hypothetical protein